MFIRLASHSDLPAINDIYNHYVLYSTASYQTEIDTPEKREHWFEHHGPDYPVLVAEEAGRVIGWASLSKFHSRAAYKPTVEDSVYLHPDYVGRGIGSKMLEELLSLGKRIGHHSVLALISADQPASLKLHEKFGFEKVAHLREVGRKFDRWLDVIFMQKML